MTDKMLAAFAAARRTGSFSTAAWELSMTQQAVSYNIKKLEEEIGFPLFARRASRVELTPGGESFAAWYDALDRGAEELAARFPADAPEGSLSDHSVRCFLTAARHGQLTAAAEELYYSPQNFQGILVSLEKGLGAALFRRENDRLTLTEAGSAWRSFFEESAASLTDVREAARAEYEACRKTALIGVSEWLDTAVLEESLAGFDGDWELRSMSNPELLDSLERGQTDAALWSRGHAPVNRGFDTIPLGQEDLCLFVPADSSACPLLVCPGWPRSYLENRAIITLETAFPDFTPTRTIRVDTLDDMIVRLTEGGCAAVGDRRFGRFRSVPGLRTIPLPETSPHIVACRRSNASEDCAARLLAHLRAAFVGDTKD